MWKNSRRTDLTEEINDDEIANRGDTADERMPLQICGRIVGTYTGWDYFGDCAYGFYDFVPNAACNIPACSCLFVNYESGQLESQNDAGNSEWGVDLIIHLRDMPVVLAAAEKGED